MTARALARLHELVKGLAATPGATSTVAELHSALDELDQALRLSTADAQGHLDALARSARLAEVGTLAAAVFHEMNQPLLGIKGFAELIRDHLGDGTQAAKLAGWAEEIRTQVSRIQALQQNLASFLRGGDATAESGEVVAAAHEALNLVGFRLTGRRVQLGLNLPDDLPWVTIPNGPLVQILVNLLGNALDAVEGQEPRAISLVASLTSGGDWVRVVVADSGCGVPPEARARLFEPFFTTKGERGTGLGLAISRRLTENFGGTLQVVDPAGLGWRQPPQTAFDLRLPVARASADTPLDSAVERFNLALQEFVAGLEVCQRVLLVEDQQALQRSLTEYLAGQGILCDAVSTAEDALEHLQACPYAVVITDKALPGIDGMELLRRVKTRWPRVESLVITDFASIESALEAIGLGAFDYLPKPLPSLAFAGVKIRAALQRSAFDERIHRMIEFLANSGKNLAASAGREADRQLAKRLTTMLASYEQAETGGRVLVLGPANLVRSAERLGFTVVNASEVEQAERQLATGGFHALVLVDEPDDEDILDTVTRLRAAAPQVGVLVIARESSLPRVADALGAGDGDTLVRPLEGRDIFGPRLVRLVARQQRVTRYRRLLEALRQLNLDLAATQVP